MVNYDKYFVLFFIFFDLIFVSLFQSFKKIFTVGIKAKNGLNEGGGIKWWHWFCYWRINKNLDLDEESDAQESEEEIEAKTRQDYNKKKKIDVEGRLVSTHRPKVLYRHELEGLCCMMNVEN